MASKAISVWLPQVIIESLLIVVSILVALGLDEWRDDRSDEEFVRAALSNFLVEIEQNRERIEDAALFNLGLLSVLSQHYAANDIKSVDEYVVMVESYSPASLQSTAWDTALATGSLAKMDYNLVTALSLTYGLQSRYDLMTQSGVNDLTSPQLLVEDRLRLATYHALRYLDGVTTIENDLRLTYSEASQVLNTALARPGDSLATASPADLAHP